MEAEKRKLCMGCMTLLNENAHESICPYCGWSEGMQAGADYLRPGSVLAERYVVGRLLSHNGEGAWYLGYDRQEEYRVWVAEYVPDTLCKRNEQTGVVSPRSGREAQYKSLMYDFIENAQILRGLRQGGSGGLVPVLDMVGYNGTAYTMYRFVEGVPLYDYLKENGGSVAWPRAKQMVIPLLNSIQALNAQGAIHRGIAPETLLVDGRGKLWLCGIAISAARTGMSELCCELFEGYSAPEQYSATGVQGAWTDVYSNAAVLYRMLTGTRPPSAEVRKERDTLYPANMVNSAIPAEISAAIDGAMLVYVEKRTQSMDALIAELLEEAASNTAVFDSAALSESGKKTQLQTQGQAGYRRRAQPPWLSAMVLTCVMLGAVVVVLCTTVLRPLLFPASSSSSSEATSSEESSAEVIDPDTLVPNFTNRYMKTVTENSLYTAKYEFIIQKEFNEDGVPEGVIVAQSTPPGTPMPEKGTIVLTISKGSQIVAMPYLVGSTIGLATRTLDDLNIRYELIKQRLPEADPGLVLKTSVQAGDQVVRDRDIIYLTIKDDTQEGPVSSGDTQSEGTGETESSGEGYSVTVTE